MTDRSCAFHHTMMPVTYSLTFIRPQMKPEIMTDITPRLVTTQDAQVV